MTALAARRTPGVAPEGAALSAPDLSGAKSGRARPPVTPKACVPHDAGASLAPARSGAPRSPGRIACPNPLALRAHALLALSRRGAMRRPCRFGRAFPKGAATGPAFRAGPERTGGSPLT